MGWLLALIFLPVLGFFLYVIFSSHFFSSTKRMDRMYKFLNKKIQPLIDEQFEYFCKNKDSLKNKVIRDYSDLVIMNLKNANSPITFTESIDVYTDGKSMFDDLCNDMENATKSIYLQFFIFRKDKIGKKIMDILCRKASEGLDVRLLYDDMGSFLTPSRFMNKLYKYKGQTLSFSPVRYGVPFTLNFRNHRKTAIIDGNIGYTGGMNVGDEYIVGLKRNPKHPWRDTHIRMTGSCVLSLRILFLTDWFSSEFGRKAFKSAEDVAKNYPVAEYESLNKQILLELKNDKPGDSRIPTQIVASGPNNRHKSEIRDLMIRMIMDAKKSVYIQSPYFTPDEAFYSALKIAALSGKDVRIIVPGNWDKIYVKAAAYEFIREMIPYGIKFYEYPGFIHAKVLLIDEEMLTIGSTNIDTRSFELHFEMNTIFYDKPFAQKYKEVFLKDQSVSSLMSKEWLDSRFILRRTTWSFCKLFSPIM